jgi:DNA-binding transcriptional LysR family regulator
MDIWHLRYFVAVAEELNFTRAAHRLNMSTSPLSQRIKDLERELGTPLFVRTHRTTGLTPSGEVLLPIARQIIEQVHDIPAVLARGAGGAGQVAGIGIGIGVPSELRTRILDLVRGELPEMAVEIHPGATASVLRTLLSGEIELAVVSGPIVLPGLSSTVVNRRPAGIVVAAGTGFDGRSSVRLAEFTRMTFATLDYEAPPEAFRKMDELLRSAGVHKRLLLDASNLAGLTHVVAAGQAFALSGLDGGIIKRIFDDEQVVYLAVEGVHLEFTTVAVWRSDRELSDDMVADLAAAMARLSPEE